MTIRRLFQSPRARRGIAAGAIVLSLGGLVLYRAPATASPIPGVPQNALRNGTSFSGPGASGTFALSHTRVLADGRQRVFAELRITADDGDAAAVRAPLAMVIALDTSGSMSGDKIAEARRAVMQLLARMDDDDQVAVVRYDANAELIQPMARVGDVRSSLMARLHRFQADGGTNIPDALAVAMAQMDRAEPGRVRRVVLVSDGLDAHRGQAEGIARRGIDGGVTVSSLGIGLDFDEGYMASLARVGRGNFGFVEDAAALQTFLHRELEETAGTRIDQATATLSLPRGLRFIRAIGAPSSLVGDGEVLLRLGALPSGETRRVVVELRADAPVGDDLPIHSHVSWREAGTSRAPWGRSLEDLSLVATASRNDVNASRDPEVYARCISALASLQQLDASAAFNRGDQQAALEILRDNQAMLADAEASADGIAKEGLREQRRRYQKAESGFAAAPGSVKGRSTSKRMAEEDTQNLAKPAF